MDQRQFTLRILRYLQADLPELDAPDVVAERLGDRLWQYAKPNPRPDFDPALDADLLRQLLSDRVSALVFTAQWDANSVGYADLVRRCVESVVEVDVDGSVGSAIARWADVVSTPAIVIVRNGVNRDRLVGRRQEGELRDWFGRISA